MESAITETTDSIFLLEKINLKVRNIKLSNEMAKTMNTIIIRFNKNITAANWKKSGFVSNIKCKF